MVQSWDDFMGAALELLMESPTARATVKYNHKKQNAIIRVTDDKKRVSMKCFSMDQLEQFIKLTSKLMLNVDPTEEPKHEDDKKQQKKAAKQTGKKGKK